MPTDSCKTVRLHEMHQGIKHIETALALNPNAHFGRERYQLGAMRSIAKAKRGKADLAKVKEESILSEAGRSLNASSKSKLSDAQHAERKNHVIEGLSGLVVLGNAWGNVDIFAALSRALLDTEDKKVGYLALLRCEELLQSRHASLNTEVAKASMQPGEIAKKLTGYFSLWRGATNKQNLRAKYAELRTAADQWQAARTNYLLARLKAGWHPDTTPSFWKDFAPPPAPTLDIAWRAEGGDNLRNWLMRNLFLTAFFALSLLVGSCAALWRTLRFCRAHLPWDRKII